MWPSFVRGTIVAAPGVFTYTGGTERWESFFGPERENHVVEGHQRVAMALVEAKPPLRV